MAIKTEVFIHRSESVTDTMLERLMPMLQEAMEGAVHNNQGAVAETYDIYVDYLDGQVKILVRPQGDVAGYVEPDSEFEHKEPVHFTAGGQA